MTKKAAVGTVLVALALAAGAGAWWAWRPAAITLAGVEMGALPRGVAPADLNVLVVTLDTTRADRLGAYGDTSGATPTLDRLAADGVVFEHAVSPAPLTLPAHSTLFTGEDPPFHGVRDNGGYILDGSRQTLAETLKAGGWATGGFIGAFVLDAKFGLDQGFDEYVDEFDINQRPGEGFALGDIARPAAEVVDHALPWLEAHKASRFFAWLHFYDPHSPYEPPEPFRTRFASRPYLGEIAYVDAQLARVLAWLDAQGLRDRTLVVVLGDHGESLGEHGEGTHGLFVYEGTQHVPLIVRAPYAGLAGRRVPAIVRTEDVMPTILTLTGQAVPSSVRGTSLVPLMTGAAADLELDAYSESIYARNHFGWSELRAFREGRYKLIDAPRPELYDLELDPGETTNIFEDRQALGDRLRLEIRRLDREAASGAPAAPAAIDPETRERLAALGYVGSFTDVAIPEGETRADPKDKIDVFNRMLQAREGRAGDPIAALEAIVADDPQIVDAWTMIGNEYFRRHEYAKAVPYYQKALALSPGYDLATINLANAYRRLGNEQAAMTGYEQYLARDPRNAYVRYQLGEIQSDLGRLGEAEQTFLTALEADPSLASAQNALGVVRFKQGRLQEARADIERALQMKPEVRLAYYNLAVLAEAEGRPAEARDLYARELSRHPDNYRAHFNLGRLFEAAGDRAAQVEAWKSAIRVNPDFAEGHILLGKLYLDLGRDLDEALTLARRGVELAPRGPLAALGHYVAADVLSRRGQAAAAAAEAAKGRAIEMRGR
ncbi:MAG: sulfatase-like hydrolase/transferase [Vicinamibacterales bacterium]